MKIHMLIVFVSLILLASNITQGVEMFGVDIDLEEEGCKKIGNSYYCFQEASLYEAPGKFVENIVCVSSEDTSGCTGASCAAIIDFGCASLVELEEDRSIEFFYKKITGDESSNEYILEDLSRGNYEIVIVPELIDFTKCTKSYNDLVYIMNCSYTDTRVTFDAEILMFDEDYEFVIFNIDTPGAGGADIFGLIWNNIIYIILIIIIGIVIWQVLNPKSKIGKRARHPI